MRTLASIFKALSDETRLKMLGLLVTEGELCVCDFVEVLDITQSKASRHLRYLVNAGLAQDRREAVWVYFRIAEKPGALEDAVLADLRRLLPDQISKGLLDALKAWRKNKAREGLACGPPTAKKRERKGRR